MISVVTTGGQKNLAGQAYVPNVRIPSGIRGQRRPGGEGEKKIYPNKEILRRV